MFYFFWPILAFLLGAVPFGLLVAKIGCNIDPRTTGSRNIGATNVARLCGKKYGAATLILDILKGFLPVALASAWDCSDAFLSVVILAAILGHAYSIFLDFKGGKAVATTVGAFLAVSFWGALLAIAACVAVITLTGFVSMGSLTLALALPVAMLLTGNLNFIPVALIVAALLFWRHRENIQRLARGEEKPWSKKTE